MPLVKLGNTACGQVIGGQWSPIPGNIVTIVGIPDWMSHDVALRTIIHTDGLWSRHSTNAKPDWVECDDDPALANHLSTNIGVAKGRPATGPGWIEPHH